MAEKAKVLSLQRDYKKFLYFVDGQGNVVAKPQSGGENVIVAPGAVQRDNRYLYFIDKEGDVSRTARASKKSAV